MTSQDYLNYALAIGSFLALGGLFLVFLYTAKIIRQVYKATKSVESAFESARNIFDVIGNQVASTGVIGKAVIDVVKAVAGIENASQSVTKAAKKTAKKVKKKLKK
jgi:hypothetical protein